VKVVPFAEKRKERKPPTVWVGECVCGLLAYETEDGKRYLVDNNRHHSRDQCQAQRTQ
jgi:hypothetical protein